MRRTIPLFLFSLVLLVFITISTSFAQGLKIHGNVSTDGMPLPGVTIVLESMPGVGTVTDFDGNYVLELDVDQTTLLVSFVGYKSQEIEVNASGALDIELLEDATELNEIVITGYSSIQKKDITGSIATVSSESFKELPIAGMDQALQGQAAGVQVTQSSGTPGGGISVRIRGSSSIGASNRPLFIVDGVAVEDGALALRSFGGQNDNALAMLNPNDIESMQILKDASAKAIYGSRAANGVVLITTKRGRANTKTTFSVDVQRGIIDAVTKIDLLNATELLALQREAVINADENPDAFGLIAGVTDAVDTDWQDEVLRQGILQQYQISARGGSENTRLYMSASYRDEEGIQLNNKFTRLAGTINLDHDATEKVTISTNLSLSKIVNHRVKGDNFLDGVYSGALKSLPYYAPYNERGELVGVNSPAFAGFPNFNPVAQAVLPRFETQALKLLGSLKLKYKILENLNFSSQVSLDYNSVIEDQYETSETAIGGYLPSVGHQGYGVYSTGVYSTVMNSSYLDYNVTIASDHKINALLGMEIMHKENTSSHVEGRLFPSDDFTYITSAGIVDAGSSFISESSLLSYFGDIDYDYKGKYLASITGRVDGSSRFGSGNKYGYFPSGALGWRISAEEFMANISWLDDLKLRASFGLTGNERIGNFKYFGTWAATTYNGSSGTGPANLGNKFLKWESTQEVNLGLDVSIWNGRLSGTIEAYSKHTNDLLLNKPLALTSGYSGQTGNIGELSNEGLELSINSVNFNKEFVWSTSFNISTNVNEVIALADSLPLFRGYTAEGVSNTNIVKEGEPLGTFWGLNFLGVDPATGDAIYEDIDGDGEISPDDGMVIGSAQPDFVGGITNRFAYKNFDLSIFFQYSYGNEVLNFSKSTLINTGADIENNQHRDALKRWTKEGQFTSVPRYELGNSYNNWHSNRFIEDGSYLRLKNVTLAYNVSPNWINKYGVESIRVFASGANLWTWTNYTGSDPEVSTLDGSTTSQGIDFFTLPQIRTILVGLNVSF